MSRLVEKLKKEKFLLMVSLPRNSVGLGRAAFYGGADAVKVHLNVKHAASGNKFGTFDEERHVLELILSTINLPVGFVPGEKKQMINLNEFRITEKMGFDFFDIYHEYIPYWMFQTTKLGKVLALGEKFSTEEALLLKQEGIDVIETSIVRKEDYGKELTQSDLINYKTLTETVDIPMIVPTQKAIKPEEIEILLETKFRGIIIGAIVTGTTPSSLEKATTSFRKAIDKL